MERFWRKLMKVLSQEIENVLKAKYIFRRSLAKCLMRFQHRFYLLSLFVPKRLNPKRPLERSIFRKASTISANIKYLVQAQSRQKLLTAIAAVNDVKMTLSELP